MLETTDKLTAEKRKISKAEINELPLIAWEGEIKILESTFFQASKKLCDLVEPGVVSIFGPTSAFSSNHVQSASEALHLPFMETRWNYNFQRSAYSIR